MSIAKLHTRPDSAQRRERTPDNRVAETAHTKGATTASRDDGVDGTGAVGLDLLGERKASGRHVNDRGTAVSRHGLSLLDRVGKSLKTATVAALIGLALLTSASTAQAQDLANVQMTPAIVRLQESAAVSQQASAAMPAIFKLAPLPKGAPLGIEGVFHAKKGLLGNYTLHFGGTANVTRSDAKGLVVELTAVVKKAEGFMAGVTEGKSRTIELTFEQQGDTPKVRFLGREVGGDEPADDVGTVLTVTGVEDGGTQMLRDPPKGKKANLKRDGVLVVDDGKRITIRYDKNVIHIDKAPAGTDPTPRG